MIACSGRRASQQLAITSHSHESQACCQPESVADQRREPRMRSIRRLRSAGGWRWQTRLVNADRNAFYALTKAGMWSKRAVSAADCGMGIASPPKFSRDARRGGDLGIRVGYTAAPRPHRSRFNCFFASSRSRRNKPRAVIGLPYSLAAARYSSNISSGTEASRCHRAD